MIGFRTPSEPVLPRDLVLWRVVKAGRVAQGVLRLLPTGRELRVYVGQDLGWSRLFRDHEDQRQIAQMSDGTLADFERLGWTREIVSE